MPTRASDRVTLAVVASPTYVRTYYQLAASTASAPAAPTTNPPPAAWSTTEPTYTAGSTSTLYTVMLIAYGSAAFEYGPVQKSSAYEAAKAAYNLASQANGLPRIERGTAVPATNSPAAPNGSAYFRHQGNLDGPIIATYARVSGAWVETPIIIRAGQIEAGEVVGLRIKSAPTGQRTEVQSNRIDFYDENNQLAGTVIGSSISGANGGILSIGSGAIGVSIGSLHLPKGGTTEFSTFSAQMDALHTNTIRSRDYTLVELPDGLANRGARVPVMHGTWFSVAALGAGQFRSYTITFPAGTFAVDPHINYSAREARYSVGVTAISATSATLIVFNATGASGGDSRVDWLAYV